VIKSVWIVTADWGDGWDIVSVHDNEKSAEEAMESTQETCDREYENVWVDVTEHFVIS
jgi:hypothetical protein